MKIKNLILSLALIINASQAMAKNPEILVFDAKENEKNLPRNFRDLADLGLNLIASAQFSESQLQEIRKKYPNEKIIILDLRRETHGLLNGQSVSWREEFNKSENNKSKNSAQLTQHEKSQLNMLKKEGGAVVNMVLEKDKEGGWFKEVQPQIVEVKEIATEEEIAKKHGFEYKRIPIQDHAKPGDKQLAEMEKFIKSVPANTKVYAHCAGGKGRTTTFLTLFDIIKNGDKMTLEQILKRQNEIGGSDFSDEDKVGYRKELAQERMQFIRDFYAKNSKKN